MIPAEFAEVVRGFAAGFGGVARFGASAPGRVNLIGEHTDYNGGYVLPMAINAACRAVGAVRPVAGVCRIISAQSDKPRQAVEFVIGDDGMRGEGWASYAAGVLSGLREFAGAEVRLPGLDIAVESDVPLGSGLASSASFEVAVAALACEAWRLTPTTLEMAKICQRAEHVYAGVPCGLMDQATSCAARAGHAMLMDCRAEAVRHVRMPGAAEARVLVVNTGVRHSLADGEYKNRREICESAAKRMGVASLRDCGLAALEGARQLMSDAELRCARHVVSENQRVLSAVGALEGADLRRFGHLMLESHVSLRDDYRVSCGELDFVVETARRTPGVFGARMTGGGFGGCAVVLATPEAVQSLRHVLPEAYRGEFGHSCTLTEAEAAGGAAALAFDDAA